MTEHLFALPSDSIAVTSDDCYTPRWVFDAMGLHFDLDVAAPPGGPWHVPCDRYYTAEDDGLTQPWEGLVWCNPPYSSFGTWADRFAAHDHMALMGFIQSEVKWGPIVFGAAEALALVSVDFARPDGGKYRWRHQVFVAFRGVGTEPAERLAAADPYGAVLYGRPQNPSLSVAAPRPVTDGEATDSASGEGLGKTLPDAEPDAASPP